MNTPLSTRLSRRMVLSGPVLAAAAVALPGRHVAASAKTQSVECLADLMRAS